MYRINSAYIPVDFSSHARAAVDLAGRFDDPQMTLAHVVADWPPFVREVLFPYAALGEDDVEFEYELIQQARASLRDHLKIDEASLEVDIGKIHEALPAQIRSHDPDAVIMGAFGESGPRPHALGSTASHVLRSASRPVLLARDFGGSPRITRIVAAVDLSSNSDTVIDHGLGLALQLGADFELVHVVPDPLAHDSGGVLMESLSFDLEELQENARARVASLFERVAERIEPDFPERERANELLENRSMLFGDPAMTLVDYASETDADLLVMGTRRAEQPHRNLGRVATAVASSTPSHTMLVPT
jgi:nucleotide-binding universal stress UspA family protein